MPEQCCVVRCRNMKGISAGVRFFRFPLEKRHRRKRELWIAAIGRKKKDGSAWMPTKSSRVCGVHFLKGEPSSVPSDPDYVPNVFGVPSTPYGPGKRVVNDMTNGENREGHQCSDQDGLCNNDHSYTRMSSGRPEISRHIPRPEEEVCSNAVIHSSTNDSEEPLSLVTTVSPQITSHSQGDIRSRVVVHSHSQHSAGGIDDVSSHCVRDQLLQLERRLSAANAREEELQRQVQYWKSEYDRLKSSLSTLENMGREGFQYYSVQYRWGSPASCK
ncbi:peroxynitrite isomerase THAP4-like isoform X5 [Ornithodoros turicata]|uniref:peroxynitrite isomerase THAP4-like isoform X5 n=1 Tax=Ornithodoros turicata TaxID=34597 RepID=UPI0031390AF9